MPDPVFTLHEGGKLEIRSTVALTGPESLAQAYTPGVGRVSAAVAEDRDLVWDYTAKGSTVAIVSDGSAVLGLGDVGPEAALPVMEGKAVLLKEFGGVNAVPLVMHRRDIDSFIDAVASLAPGYGAILLEDIAAPDCFEIERRLRDALDIPVFHDDQHGTAAVVLAGMFSVERLTGRPLADTRVVMLGSGAAGSACAHLLLEAGAQDVVCVDREGIVHTGRKGLSGPKADLAATTNRAGLTGGLDVALTGSHAVIGVSGPGLLPPDLLALMSDDAAVFALANPIPEVLPSEVPGNVRIVATGRSDFPNQINNVLAFPGICRGLLDVRASAVTDDVIIETARAISSLVGEADLAEGAIIPSAFDPRVVPAVSKAVRRVATASGVARVKGKA
ncbi:NAD(P)-dependent malic enzyme [Sinosporangium album]|nr:NADP-dependent malic enzyme [Sinosporangium album]